MFSQIRFIMMVTRWFSTIEIDFEAMRHVGHGGNDMVGWRDCFQGYSSYYTMYTATHKKQETCFQDVSSPIFFFIFPEFPLFYMFFGCCKRLTTMSLFAGQSLGKDDVNSPSDAAFPRFCLRSCRLFAAKSGRPIPCAFSDRNIGTEELPLSWSQTSRVGTEDIWMKPPTRLLFSCAFHRDILGI